MSSIANELSIIPNILIVDDQLPNLQVLATILKERNYKVRKAINGQVAINTIEKEAPDLILLDIKMPDMDGYEICQYLKSNPETKDIPVIFISALNGVLDKVKAFGVGSVDYITKPFHEEEVIARVNNQLTIRNLQKKSDRLLLNILPQSIVDRLKQRDLSAAENYCIAESFDCVSILFADLVGFTEMSANMPAIELVNLLNQIFSRFDRLCEDYSVEKIKTIGDAYMAASGIPIPRTDGARAIANMALDMQKIIGSFQVDTPNSLQLRIGINSGPVVAGIIGTRKLSYDLWGDTVNTASRMESNGIPGKIQVTEQTYHLLKDNFECVERGDIEIKGKGMMKTYFLIQ
ncbi:adenylate/guanylate cyclase domain-containing protein [Roseofilum casamattae]|uniref:Adenylate/guanylate cyclase domain-containing protein n=1 Tax=Roseofilum casamattae BLCC-M143 TaxID=3022442 RepID=A0ABT7BUJ2_9CYAN|nr:adenylate/guanylate cyclase domain-containing protein [Roseofilum casamattae]MDJ1182853.1 adenylate/guanylate cyclase domain-containing protein [Roseofilum casamattae BLCC-M143]